MTRKPVKKKAPYTPNFTKGRPSTGGGKAKPRPGLPTRIKLGGTQGHKKVTHAKGSPQGKVGGKKKATVRRPTKRS